MRFKIYNIETVDCSSCYNTVYPNPESVELLLDMLEKVAKSNAVKTIGYIQFLLYFESQDISIYSPKGTLEEVDDNNMKLTGQEADDNKILNLYFDPDDMNKINEEIKWDENISRYYVNPGLNGLINVITLVKTIHGGKKEQLPEFLQDKKFKGFRSEVYVVWKAFEEANYDINEFNSILIESKDTSIYFVNHESEAFESPEYLKFLNQIEFIIAKHWPNKYEVDPMDRDDLTEEGLFVSRHKKVELKPSIDTNKIKQINNLIMNRKYYSLSVKEKEAFIEELEKNQVPYVTLEGELCAVALNNELNLYMRKILDFNNLEGLDKLTSIKKLNLEGNGLKTLPESIRFLKSLESLDLSSNSLENIPESICRLSSLKKLYLKKNPIKTIPESISNLKSLNWLDLSSTNMKIFPNSMKTMNSLYQVVLSEMLDIPESISKLKHVKKLDLTAIRARQLPESIGELTFLESLYIQGDFHSHSSLYTFPESFGNLTSLRSLEATKGRITSIPRSFGKLKNLFKLLLKDNKLTALPDTFGNLLSLKILDLSENQLNTLPESFGNLLSLTKLDLSVNQISIIPESFGNFSSLRELKLNHNPLTTLPDSLGNLTSLKTLSLYKTQLSTLPESILNLKSLKELDLGGTPLVTKQDPTTKEILEQLKANGVKVNLN